MRSPSNVPHAGEILVSLLCCVRKRLSSDTTCFIPNLGKLRTRQDFWIMVELLLLMNFFAQYKLINLDEKATTFYQECQSKDWVLGMFLVILEIWREKFRRFLSTEANSRGFVNMFWWTGSLWCQACIYCILAPEILPVWCPRILP